MPSYPFGPSGRWVDLPKPPKEKQVKIKLVVIGTNVVLALASVAAYVLPPGYVGLFGH